MFTIVIYVIYDMYTVTYETNRNVFSFMTKLRNAHRPHQPPLSAANNTNVLDLN
jgi:hypothetical protein